MRRDGCAHRAAVVDASEGEAFVVNVGDQVVRQPVVQQALRILEASPLERHREGGLEGVLEPVVGRLCVYARDAVLREEADAGAIQWHGADAADHVPRDTV